MILTSGELASELGILSQPWLSIVNHIQKGPTLFVMFEFEKEGGK